ncbi:MAG: RIP metalloprotease RseP [Chromatiales bacterium]|nr:RIP metalloprotease RseP [Chromatiales bacterium]
MADFLFTIVALLVALSILIAVHEWGHYVVARWCGVKVLRFSIGFGNPVWQRNFGPDNTEFVIAAIPLGGYVKMVDEREGEVAEADLPRAFTRQSLAKRAAIVVAGPVLNFIFAIFAYWLMFVSGIDGVKPLLAEVAPESIAYEVGLRGGEEIIAVNGEMTPTWQAVMEKMMPLALLQQPVRLTLYENGLSTERELNTSTVSAMQKPMEVIEQLGLKLQPLRIAPILDTVVEGDPAHRAGLRSGDEIRIIDEQPIDEWSQLVALVEASPGKPLQMTVMRNGSEVNVEVRPRTESQGDKSFGKIGVTPYIDRERLQALRSELKLPMIPAISAALTKTWDMSLFTLRMFGQMVIGRASIENISGPIGIAQYAKRSAELGFEQFLSFLAIVSLSLGVLNLLPIPVLDGGHLMFYLVEFFKGKPVSEQTEAIGQRIGLTMLLALTSLAIYNDIVRLAG